MPHLQTLADQQVARGKRAGVVAVNLGRIGGRNDDHSQIDHWPGAEKTRRSQVSIALSTSWIGYQFDVRDWRRVAPAATRPTLNHKLLQKQLVTETTPYLLPALPNGNAKAT